VNRFVFSLFFASILFACKKDNPSTPPPPAGAFSLTRATVDDSTSNNLHFNSVSLNPVIKLSFSAPLNTTTASGNIVFYSGAIFVKYDFSFSNGDSTIVIKPQSPLNALTTYTLIATRFLSSKTDSTLGSNAVITLNTSIDSTNKFPLISDSSLLTLVEQQTFKYFYNFGHPVSGLARERNTSADIVTTGGSGFGIMAILVGIQRNFISRAAGLSRLDTIVNFLTTKAQRYHGAFPHWMNGVTGATVPFSTDDNGADLVETSYLMQGLLTARQYFNSNSDPEEIALRSGINNLWNAVEWNWFRQSGQNVLYWHWSPTQGFKINMQINGWDEAMIVYALAASSPIDSNRIPKIVYDNGWALNGGIKNGRLFYGITLPLGPNYGGPLFFAHYSFLGINPNGLTDTYADYWQQNQNHSLINFNYCVNNPQHYNGYSSNCWGLTASDDNDGYSAHSPTNDDGVISPTAAISSLPYTPTQSMDALHFFYYKLGDKLWGQYGFIEAFNLTNIWFANSYLAIDQGPEIIMIENYRSGLLWNLFMSCPEIKTGMKSLNFQSPNLN
jgi:hypothetical protein